jgi:hypothetical protein
MIHGVGRDAARIAKTIEARKAAKHRVHAARPSGTLRSHEQTEF